MKVKILDVFLIPDNYLYCSDCNILILKNKKQCPICDTLILSNSEDDIIGYVEDIINNNNNNYDNEITVY